MNDLETCVSAQLHERAATARPDDRLADVLHGLGTYPLTTARPGGFSRSLALVGVAAALGLGVVGVAAIAGRSGDDSVPAAADAEPSTTDASTIPEDRPAAGAPGSLVVSTTAVVSEARRQLDYRGALASAQLELLGFPNNDLNNQLSTDAAGVTTLVASDPDQSRTLTITMTPGTMLLPENHDRAPITTTENTADRISMEYNSNNGWRFTLVVERTGAAALPSEDELGNLLYGIDP